MRTCAGVATKLACFLAVLCGARGEADESDTCDYEIVQTIPDGLNFKQELSFQTTPTHVAWLDLIRRAERTLQIVTFQFAMLPEESEFASHPTAEPGRLVFEALESAARDRKVKVEILYGLDVVREEEQRRLQEAGVEFKRFDVQRLLKSGIQHAKFIIADERHFYLGSSNLDWRALTHVKEIGIAYKQCRSLASDLAKIFKTYQYMDKQETLPRTVPEELISFINGTHPLTLKMDNVNSKVFFSTSPTKFDGANNHRTSDLDAILDAIDKAKDFVYIAVMNYGLKFFKRSGAWFKLDLALRKAVFERNLRVRLTVSKSNKWLYTDERKWYRSLHALKASKPIYGGLEVKFFSVPIDEFQADIKFARLKHDKFVVTDKTVYFGTSNWKPEYFMDTTGVGLSITPDPEELKENPVNIISKMKELYLRDYESEFTMFADNPHAHEPNECPTRAKPRRSRLQLGDVGPEAPAT